MTDVFISYSREDSEFVKRIHEALQKRARNVWIDWEDIPLSADWWNEIQDGIERADTFVFVISPASITSPVCNFEIAHALLHNKRIVPILLREVNETEAFGALAATKLNEGAREILGSRDFLALAREAWNALARHNWVYFSDDEDFDTTFDKFLNILDTDLAFVKMHTRLLVRALEWQKNGENNAYALRGIDLQQAETWLETTGNKEPSPTELQTRYILQSRRNTSARQRMILGLTLVALVVLGIAAIIAFVQSERAVDNQNIALTAESEAIVERDRALERLSQLVAARADALGTHDYTVALLLSVEAMNQLNTFEARSSLGNALNNAPAQLNLRLTASRLSLEPAESDIQDTRISRNMVFTADGRQVMIANAPDSVSYLAVWDVESGQLVAESRIGGAEGAVGSAGRIVFSGNGRWAAVRHSSSSTISFYDVEANTIVEPAMPIADVESLSPLIALNNDGSLLAVKLSTDEVEVWDVQQRIALYRVPFADRSLTNMALTDEFLILAYGDGLIAFRDVQSGEETSFQIDVIGGVERVFLIGMAVSNDGSVLGVALDGPDTIDLLLWDIDSKSMIGEPYSIQTTEHNRSPLPLSVHPNRQFIAARINHAAHIVDVVNGATVLTIPDNSRYGEVPLAFSPSGEYFATMDPDGAIGIVRIRGRNMAYTQMIQHLGDNDFTVHFIDEAHISLFTGEGSQMWDVDTGLVESMDPQPHVERNLVIETLQTPDGNYNIQANCWDESAWTRAGCLTQLRFIEPSSEEIVEEIETGIFGGRNFMLIHHPTRPIVAVVSDDSGNKGGLRLYDSSTFQPLTGPVETAPISQAAFDASGDYLALGYPSGNIVVLDWQNEIPDLVESVNSLKIDVTDGQLAVSSNGEWVVAGSENRLQIWNWSTGEPLVEFFFDSEHLVQSFDISHDGRYLVIAQGSPDGTTVRRWTLDPESWRIPACRLAGRDLTDEEWEDYFGEVPYNETCSAVLQE